MVEWVRLSLKEERKYTAFWAVFLMGSLLRTFDMIGSSEWVTITSLTYLTYVGGNYGEHKIKASGHAVNP